VEGMDDALYINSAVSYFQCYLAFRTQYSQNIATRREITTKWNLSEAPN